jgi:hypothetical protein
MSAFAVQHVVSNQPDAHAAENKISVASTPNERIIVQNYYYAQPGKSEDLYQGLLDASDVREKLGFTRGRLLRRIAMSGDAFGTPTVDKSGPEDLPDVVWECEFPDCRDTRTRLPSGDRKPRLRSRSQALRPVDPQNGKSDL